MYNKFNIDDNTDIRRVKKKDYPILSNLYEVLEEERRNYKENVKIYREDTITRVNFGFTFNMCR